MFFVGPSNAAKQLSSDINVKVFDLKLGENVLDVKWKKNLQEQFIENSPSLIISYLGDQEYTFDDLADYYFLLDDIAAAGCGVIHLARQFSNRWNPQFRLPVCHCRGNVSFATDISDMVKDIKKWFWNGVCTNASKNVDGIGSEGLVKLVIRLHADAELN